MKKFLLHLIRLLFLCFPIKQNKLFFETLTGEVKDQANALYKYIKETHPEKYQCYWGVAMDVDVSELAPREATYRRTVRYYYHLMTSQYWFKTHSGGTTMKKRPGQRYIQLWHGPGATKKEGYDLYPTTNNGATMPHAAEWDYFIATDEDNARYIKTAVNLKVPSLLFGSMRTDALVKAPRDAYQKCREQLGISPEEVAVLYAPTYREQDFTKGKIVMPIHNVSRMPNVRLIMRLHPEVKKAFDPSEYGPNMIDGNQVADIFDLYHAADILVTDYSSVSMEFCLLGKPMMFYMYDLEDMKNEKDFYFDYLNHLASPIIRTESELIHAISNSSAFHEQHKEQYHAYTEKYNRYNDGHVCERFFAQLDSGAFLDEEKK